LAGAALLQLGCAAQLQLLDRGPTAGVSPCSFWPPPPGSATWLADAPPAVRGDLSAVADALQVGLNDGGYSDQRWYPIGIGNSHGFAVTTRLERVGSDTQAELSERWSTVYPDAVSLRWLEQARTPPLPGPGRYRVFLLSYSDLPIGRAASAPIWNEETVMDWPNAEQRRSFRQSGSPRPVAGYRFGVYEYDYEWDEAEGRGKLVPSTGAHEGSRPLPAAVRRALAFRTP
jgi:hypothetical protein